MNVTSSPVQSTLQSKNLCWMWLRCFQGPRASLMTSQGWKWRKRRQNNLVVRGKPATLLFRADQWRRRTEGIDCVGWQETKRKLGSWENSHLPPSSPPSSSIFAASPSTARFLPLLAALAANCCWSVRTSSKSLRTGANIPTWLKLAPS